MSDINIIAAVLDSRGAFDSVEHRVDEAALSPQATVWWTAIVDWYARDPAATAVELGMIRERVKRDLNPKHVDAIIGWFDDVPESVSPGNVVSEVIAVQRQAKGFEVQSAIAANESGEKIGKLMDELGVLLRQEQGGGEPTFEITSSTDAMLDKRRGERIPLAPESLNRRVGGGAVRGSHILVFGRPDSGKTLFTINLVAHFLKSNYSVLYIGNEEPTTRTNVRLMGSLMERTIQQVEKNLDKALTYVNEQGWWKRYRSVQMTPGTMAEIEDAISYFKPDVVILDQLRNVRSGGQKLTNRLEENATGFRALLSKYNVLGISVTQAGDKTERHGQEVPAVLSMSDVDSSRTGLPGQCDLMLGVGVTEELFSHGKRMLSLAKNKLSTERTPFLVDVDLERTLIR